MPIDKKYLIVSFVIAVAKQHKTTVCQVVDRIFNSIINKVNLTGISTNYKMSQRIKFSNDEIKKTELSREKKKYITAITEYDLLHIFEFLSITDLLVARQGI